jgi:hypothetical protein
VEVSVRWVFLLVCALLCASFATASSTLEITTTEVGRITSYFDEYWVVNVDGNVTITNPTSRDLFSASLRYDIGSLTLVEGDGTTYFQNGQLLIARIPANTTIRIPYNIVGISLVDPTLVDKGVLYTGFTQFNPVVYSDAFGVLDKAEPEDETVTGQRARLISVYLKNPTGFQFTVNSMRVFKTPELDPNDVLEEWTLVNDTAPITLDADAEFVRDFLDYDPTEGEVYWLSSDVYVSRVSFIDLSNITRFTEENLTIPPELLNYTINDTNGTNRSTADVTELYARRVIDQQLVTTDRPVQLSLIITNFAQKLYTFTVSDELPPGFVFIEGDGWAEDNGRLTYTGTISGKAAHVASYTARLEDTSSSGLDYFDAAEVNYVADDAAKTIYSDRVPFIRQFLPEKKVYVQKKIRYEDDDEVIVTILVQNLGATPVPSLILKEHLDDNDLFSEITEIPTEKGLWEIPPIEANGMWEVSYRTSEGAQLNVLPGVYGIPAADILKSLVLENVISSAWQTVRTALLEVIGIALLLGLPVVYYFIRRRD